MSGDVSACSAVLLSTSPQVDVFQIVHEVLLLRTTGALLLLARVARKKEGASISTISRYHAVVKRSLRSFPCMPVSVCVVVDDDRVIFVHFYHCHPVVFLKWRIVELNRHSFLVHVHMTWNSIVIQCTYARTYMFI